MTPPAANVTNGATNWSRLADLAGVTNRDHTTIRRVARGLNLDVRPMPELRKGHAGKAPLCIPSTDAPALIDLLKSKGPIPLHSNMTAKSERKGPKAKAKTKRPSGKDVARYVLREDRLSKVEQLRHHVKALAILCRELDAEVTVNHDGVAEVHRMTIETIKAGSGNGR
jgi:hypothetical protein